MTTVALSDRNHGTIPESLFLISPSMDTTWLPVPAQPLASLAAVCVLSASVPAAPVTPACAPAAAPATPQHQQLQHQHQHQLWPQSRCVTTSVGRRYWFACEDQVTNAFMTENICAEFDLCQENDSSSFNVSSRQQLSEFSTGELLVWLVETGCTWATFVVSPYSVESYLDWWGKCVTNPCWVLLKHGKMRKE